jgi:serine/threonine-protein kinase RsbW
MSAPAKTWMIEKTFHSDMDEAHRLVESIIGHLDSEGWSCREQFQIQMAVEEGVTNAIEHGNKRDPSKKVKVDCHVTNSDFTIMIEDEGKGFTRDDLANCLSDERLELPRGRGVMLIETFMSEVDYMGRGNIVRMKRIKDDPKFNREDEE